MPPPINLITPASAADSDRKVRIVASGTYYNGYVIYNAQMSFDGGTTWTDGAITTSAYSYSSFTGAVIEDSQLFALSDAGTSIYSNASSGIIFPFLSGSKTVYAHYDGHGTTLGSDGNYHGGGATGPSCGPFTITGSYTGAPTLSGTAKSTTSVQLTITSSSTLGGGWLVYYKKSSDSLYTNYISLKPTTTSYTVTGLTTDTTYDFLVAESANKITTNKAYTGSYSPTQESYLQFGNQISLTLSSPLSTPVITITDNNSATTQPTVSWSAITGANSYTVYIGGATYTTTSTSYKLTMLGNGVTETVKVKATDTTGVKLESAWSTAKSATNGMPVTCSAPSISASTIDYSRLSVSIASVTGAGSYQIQYATNSSFSGASTVFASSGSNTLTGLSANTAYYIRARALASNEHYSDSGWSSTIIKLTAKAPLNTPTITTIMVVNANQLSLTFDKVSNANQYIIEYSTSSSFASKQTITVT